MKRPGFHLAELNLGRLLAPADEPRVAKLMAALDRINGLGKRMPGFVWMMQGSGEPGTHGPSEAAFGCDWLADAKLWQQRACTPNAAE